MPEMNLKLQLRGAAAVLGMALASAGQALAQSAEALPAGEYFVAVSGNDANPCDEVKPCRTIQRVVGAGGPGVTVNVRAGVYAEQVRMTASGAAGRYFVLRAYPGEVAVIDGATAPSGADPVGIFLSDVSHVKVQSMEIRNFSSAAATATPSGILVQGAGADIELSGNHVHHIGTTAGANGNAYGIAVLGTRAPASLRDVRVHGNEVSQTHTGNSETVVFSGNVEQWEFTNNRVHDVDNIGVDAIGYEGVAPDPAYDRARNGRIADNTIYNVSSYGNPAYGNSYQAAGIYVDGGSDIVIERNDVHLADYGIEIASEHKGKNSARVAVRSNLLYANRLSALSIGGATRLKGGTDSCVIVGNTLYRNDTEESGSGELQVQFNAVNNLFYNNIVHTGAHGLVVHTPGSLAAAPVFLENNLYFAPLNNLVWEWRGARYASLTGFTATGNDTRSLSAQPQFVDPVMGDFTLLPGSAAIDRGIILDNPSELGPFDLAGKPRVLAGQVDIGAYEQ